MSQVQSNLIINLGGNAQQNVMNLQAAFSGVTNIANQFNATLGQMGSSAFAFQNIKNALGDMHASIQSISQPFVTFNQKAKEMQAITGATDEATKKLTDSAKDLASEFGTSAADNLGMFQVALSRLTPELGDSESFMRQFGETSNMLARTMYGDVDGATKAITTAMNQYGVNLHDPIEATAKMVEFTDKLAKAAQVGAVEMPELAQALNQTGSLAKSAGVDIGQLAALMEVSGKFTEHGSIGYALRDMMMTMQKGDFIPPQIRERMEKMGVSTSKLADSSVDLREKLLELRKFQQGDQAAFNQLFGMYANNANGLVNNINLYDEYIAKSQEFGGALKSQSDIMGESYQNKINSITEAINNFKISIGEATGMVLPYSEMFLQGLVSLGQFATGMNSMIDLVKTLGSVQRIQTAIQYASNVAEFAGLMIMQALTSATMAAMLPWLGFIAVFAAVTAAVVYAWNHFEGFRVFLYELWATVKQVFSNIGDFVAKIFSPIGEMMDAFANHDWAKVAAGAGKLAVNLATAPMQLIGAAIGGELTKGVGEARAKGKVLAHESFQADQEAETSKNAAVSNPAATINAKGKPIADTEKGAGKTTASGAKTAGSGGGSGRNVSVVIQSMKNEINLHVTNLKEGTAEIKRIVTETLVAVSDAEVDIVN